MQGWGSRAFPGAIGQPEVIAGAWVIADLDGGRPGCADQLHLDGVQAAQGHGWAPGVTVGVSTLLRDVSGLG